MIGLSPSTRDRIARAVERDGKYEGEHGLKLSILVATVAGKLTVTLNVCLHHRWRAIACATIQEALDRYDSFLKEKRTQKSEQESLF